MKRACKAAQKVFQQTQCVRSAVVAATESMENCNLINAGLNGSSLTKTGNIECDAGILCVNDTKWSALTALQNVTNPIKGVEALYLKSMQRNQHGLISPIFLCGDAATKWCKENNVQTCDKVKLSAKQKKIFDDYSKVLTENEKITANNHGTCGVVGIDALMQKMFVTASSGGIWMKNNGRIGPSALVGCGFDGKKSKNGLIGCCGSGSGEYLMQFRLAQNVCNELIENEEMKEVVLTRIFEQFGEFVSDSECQRSAGCIVMKVEKNANGMDVDINWAHNSEAMGVAILSNDKIKTFMSCNEMKQNQKKNSVVIGGVSVNI